MLRNYSTIKCAKGSLAVRQKSYQSVIFRFWTIFCVENFWFRHQWWLGIIDYGLMTRTRSQRNDGIKRVARWQAMKQNLSRVTFALNLLSNIQNFTFYYIYMYIILFSYCIKYLFIKLLLGSKLSPFCNKQL